MGLVLIALAIIPHFIYYDFLFSLEFDRDKLHHRRPTSTVDLCGVSEMP